MKKNRIEFRVEDKLKKEFFKKVKSIPVDITASDIMRILMTDFIDGRIDAFNKAIWGLNNRD